MVFRQALNTEYTEESSKAKSVSQDSQRLAYVPNYFVQPTLCVACDADTVHSPFGRRVAQVFTVLCFFVRPGLLYSSCGKDVKTL